MGKLEGFDGSRSCSFEKASRLIATNRQRETALCATWKYYPDTSSLRGSGKDFRVIIWQGKAIPSWPIYSPYFCNIIMYAEHMALERLRRRREDSRSGSLQEAVRSSSLMGGLYQRTQSKMLGEAQAERHMMVRAHHFCIHLSLPIDWILSGQGQFQFPAPSIYYTPRVLFAFMGTIIPHVIEIEKKIALKNHGVYHTGNGICYYYGLNVRMAFHGKFVSVDYQKKSSPFGRVFIRKSTGRMFHLIPTFATLFSFIH